jgi:hypothetical protein
MFPPETLDPRRSLSEIFPDQKYELIEGKLINKMGQSPPRAYTITLPQPEGIRSETYRRRIIVYRNPGPEEYNSVTIYQAHDCVPFDQIFVSLDQIFPAP